jgi:Histidine kinase-like ATPase domain
MRLTDQAAASRLHRVNRTVAVDLLPGPDAPGRARRIVAEAFGGEVDDSELETAKLLVSELVTNAVVHGKGTITLRAELSDSRLLVEVIDEGTGFERVTHSRDTRAFGGRGLHIVDAEASRWGIRGGTTNVWFELERSRRLAER